MYRETTVEWMKPRIKSMIWNIRKQKTTMQNNKGEKRIKKKFLLLFNYSCPHFSPITLPSPTQCKLFFISISVSFISDWVFFMLLSSSLSSLSILITSVLNSTSHRLLISILCSSFSGVLICSLIWAMFLCSFWPPPCVCFYL